MTELPPVNPPVPNPASGAVAPAGKRVAATTPVAAPQAAASAAEPTQREVREAIATTLAEAAPHAAELEFQVESGETIVRVVDRETREVVRQIPTEEVVQLRRAIEHVQALIIRSKA